MPSIEQSFYLTQHLHCVNFLYNGMQYIDGCSLLFQRYVRKGNDVKNQAIFGFSLLPKLNSKNPVKCDACAVAGKIETNYFSRNMPISNDPVVRISRNLAKK